MTQLTGGGRTIFLIVIGLKVMGQTRKRKTQFEQLTLLVMSNRRNRSKEIPEEILLQKSI